MAASKLMSMDGSWVREPVQDGSCPFCGHGEPRVSYYFHYCFICVRCDKRTCSFNKAHEKKHKEEELQAWLKKRELTRDSLYELPVLGANSRIKGLPEKPLRDVIYARDRVLAFKTDDTLACIEWTDLSVPLWKMPPDLRYLLVAAPFN